MDNSIDLALGCKIIALRDRVVSNFTLGNWEEIGLLTGCCEIINSHPRLLRSLHWNDDDYAGHVLSILHRIIKYSPEALKIIEKYLDKKFPSDSNFISVKQSERKITFAPNVFRIPDDIVVEDDLVALMIPFSQEFEVVCDTIKKACSPEYRCQSGNDIWEESVIIQDIFNLIYRSQVVIVDFTGKNPNVMYELGIAHTLGKHVIPITQSLEDIPFDITHHRALKYLKNSEGLAELNKKLSEKIRQILYLNNIPF